MADTKTLPSRTGTMMTNSTTDDAVPEVDPTSVS